MKKKMSFHKEKKKSQHILRKNFFFLEGTGKKVNPCLGARHILVNAALRPISDSVISLTAYLFLCKSTDPNLRLKEHEATAIRQVGKFKKNNEFHG